MELGCFPYYPFCLWGASVFCTSLNPADERGEGSPASLPPLDCPTVDDGLGFEQVKQFLEESEQEVEYLRASLTAILNHSTDQRRLIFGEAADRVILRFAALQLALPLEMAHSLSFTTYSQDPESHNALMCATSQPAVKSYFFGKGYQDLHAAITDTWKRNLDTARHFGKSAADLWDQGEWACFGSVAYGASAISVVAFGTAWFLLLSLLHIVILFSVFSIIYLCFSIVLLIEKSYLFLHRVFTACPHCHKKSLLPVYKCPKCNVDHDNLIPGSYGILKRKCQCDEVLPATFFNGRSKLAARCAKCGRPIESNESTPICIPIIGGPSVGKTCYLFAATQSMLEKVAPARGWKIRFINTQTEQLYSSIKGDFSRGTVPRKTAELNASAFNFFISGEFKPDKVVYFYDAAGEAFQRSEHLESHGFYSYLHGFLFLVDPFSIAELADGYGKALDRAQVKPSDMNLEDAYDAMIINLEKNHGIKRIQKVNKPCAIVINKVDALDLETKVGEAAIKAYAQTHAMNDLNAARDALCHNFLSELGLGNFLRKLGAKFKKTRFFTCSALGQTSGGAFAPYRVEDPMLWLMEDADRDLRG